MFKLTCRALLILCLFNRLFKLLRKLLPYAESIPDLPDRGPALRSEESGNLLFLSKLLLQIPQKPVIFVFELIPYKLLCQPEILLIKGFIQVFFQIVIVLLLKYSPFFTPL